MDDAIRLITIYAIPIIFAITLHEAAHGYVARHFGDATAFIAGRVTLNTLKHIDPVGTVVLPVILAILSSGQFVFGYAKPVPVNFGNLRNPKQDMVWVALAGPGSNFVQAIVWSVIGAILTLAGSSEPFFKAVVDAGILVNVVMFAFNLLPIPPLDGGRIVTGLLPKRLAIPFSGIERYGLFIVIALIAFPIFRPLLALWMGPLIALVYGFIGLVLRIF